LPKSPEAKRWREPHLTGGETTKQIIPHSGEAPSIPRRNKTKARLEDCDVLWVDALAYVHDPAGSFFSEYRLTLDQPTAQAQLSWLPTQGRRFAATRGRRSCHYVGWCPEQRFNTPTQATGKGLPRSTIAARILTQHTTYERIYILEYRREMMSSCSAAGC